MKKLIRFALVLLLAIGLFALGRWSVGTSGSVSPDDHGRHASQEEPALWTCPMHPQIKLPDFGPCPICGMDLVRMSSSSSEGPRQLVMSPESKRLAGIITARVERKFVTMPVRMVGKIDYDETTVRTISAWVPGRLDRLYVDYTGISVKAGDHLVRLYSPELYSAQEELLAARKRVANTTDVSEFLLESNLRAYQTARDKLVLWGLTESQVDEIEARGTAEDHVMLTSPTSGVVIRKALDQGAYVKTGTPIYTIADLGHLWVRLDAYEQDLPWLRYGQDVAIETEALPGETFHGRIIFLDPMVSERTRTVKVRVNIDNKGGRLKPGMFVRAVAEARVADGGQVIAPSLAGKWICPMHPEIIKDERDQCDVCGMDLVPVEELGMITSTQEVAEEPLVVPSSAVLVTGKRAVVYVEDPGAERPTYEGRVIVLGPRTGEHYLVRSGLEEGELVVVNGAFRIDSSMQIKAKPSMMSIPAEVDVFHGPEGDHFRASMAPFQKGYFALQAALAGDDLETARSVLDELAQALEGISASGLPSSALRVWSEEGPLIKQGLRSAAFAKDIEGIRSGFLGLSEGLLNIERSFGHVDDATYYEVFCPMAFDNRGAPWLQTDDALRNPYFGASMLRCGEVRDEFERIVAKPAPVEEEGTEPDPETEPVDEQEQDHDHGAMREPAEERGGAAPALSLLRDVFKSYLELQEALAADDVASARTARSELLPRVVAAAASDELASKVTTALHSLHSTLLGIAQTATIDELRASFEQLSIGLIAVVDASGNASGKTLHLVHCPMAMDGAGADWLQVSGKLANPYFGAAMLRCGTVKRELVVQ